MYVVTGSTGNTGSVVASQLLAAGKAVRGIGRSAERLQRLAQQGGEPFVADLTDSEALTKAFRGAEAVYVVIPPNYAATDPRADQQAVTESIASALERSGVKHAVALSSVGADKPDKTGPVVGLHRLEERLSRIAGLNLLCLRAAYFMENNLAQAGIIHKMGMAAGALRGDLPIPMIACRDIGAAAAQAMLNLDFTSHQCRELLGAADLTMSQVASVIGKAISLPNLKYNQASDDRVRASMMQMGMSANMAALMLEMSAAINSGYMKPLEPRGPGNTTPTTFFSFVREQFVPIYKGRVAA